jgi:hypothetical protein
MTSQGHSMKIRRVISRLNVANHDSPMLQSFMKGSIYLIMGENVMSPYRIVLDGISLHDKKYQPPSLDAIWACHFEVECGETHLPDVASFI